MRKSHSILLLINNKMSEETMNFDNTPSANGIQVEESNLRVELIKDHISNPNKKQAQLRMVIQKTYPAARIGNSLNGSIYDLDDFDFQTDGGVYEENRVAWIDVPVNATPENVQQDLQKFPNARIYKILSLQPILTEEQVNAMEQGISEYTAADGTVKPVDMDYYKEKQRIPNEDGEWANYKGLPQYRQTAFSPTGQEDIDTREKEYQEYKNNGSFELNEIPSREEIEEKMHVAIADAEEF
jgi:hypothetical protein